MKKTMKIYMAAALLAVVSPAILAETKRERIGDRRRDHGRR